MVTHGDIGPHLRALLDERDDLRIRVNMAEDTPGFGAHVFNMRLRLGELDRAILKQWQTPEQ